MTEETAIRRGLPRTPGGEPWPPPRTIPASAPARPPEQDHVLATDTAKAQEEAPTEQPQHHPASPHASPLRTPARTAVREGVRPGLPRTPGGPPWPPAPTPAARSVPAPETAPQNETTAGGNRPVSAQGMQNALPHRQAAETPAFVAAADVPRTPHVGDAAPDLEQPITADEADAGSARSGGPASADFAATRTGEPEAEAAPKRAPLRAPWVRPALLGAAAVLCAGLLVVACARWLTGLPFMRAFLSAYPGEYRLPDGSPDGIPLWLEWQHFFNAFLMVLIVRTGWQVRKEKRAPAYWTPRRKRGPSSRISLTLWLHQSLDLLWLANGAAFAALLFTTGQWVRIVPTSWEAIPNALSAALQYLSLDWPAEDGWSNYNSLQQLAYFTTVFLAAPLSAATGLRMSGLWPQSAHRLNALYTLERARSLHFPLMVYFVAFIVVHVELVLATGAMRNLNHMYGGQDALNWTGFWIFAASAALIAGAWIAVRPTVIAPIASVFGKVSSR